MTEQDIDFESLPADIKDKLAELELELSEGKINIYQIILHFSNTKKTHDFYNYRYRKVYQTSPFNENYLETILTL